MIWIALSVALVSGADWRRLALLGVALASPIPALLGLGLHWWRHRSETSMRAPWFCDAVSTELRAGATLRRAVSAAALSVDALEVAALCKDGAPMPRIARAARSAFPEIGDELGALLARSEGIGVGPASIFEELADLALAEVAVSQEVATAAAPAKAAAAVLLSIPAIAAVAVATRGSFDTYLAQPTQRGAALLGAALTVAGVAGAILILRGAR
jgi:hypothetical protein